MRVLLILSLLISGAVQAQWKSFVIGAKGDTLDRVDMKDRKQGPWVVHVEELRGEPGYEEEGNFRNGKKEGIWRRFSLEGDLIAIEQYRWGQKDGKNMYFTHAGEPEREESWRAIDPQNPYDTVRIYDVADPTKLVGTKVVKLEVQSVKHGTWRYYNVGSGTIAKEEEWVMDKPKTADVAASGDDLAPINVGGNDSGKAAEKKTAQKPKEVLEFEKKNSGRKKVRVRDGSTGY
jgi:antitoxin component YwqK of YwqJK toxin-antitoxin module